MKTVLENRQSPIRLDRRSQVLLIFWDCHSLPERTLDGRMSHGYERPFLSDLSRKEKRMIDADAECQLQSLVEVDAEVVFRECSSP